jgi:LacI family transcriptional regulator
MPGTNPICKIGQDSLKSGYLAARLLHLFTGKTNSPVAVFYAPMSYHISKRKDGFLCYTKEQNIKTVIKRYTGNDGKLISEKEITAFLRKHQDLQGIFVSYSDSCQIALATKERRENGNFFIIGFDLVPTNYKLLKEGMIDAIIDQRPQEQSYQALLNLYRHVVLEDTTISNIEMPIDIYFKENLPKENDIIIT